MTQDASGYSTRPAWYGRAWWLLVGAGLLLLGVFFLRFVFNQLTSILLTVLAAAVLATVLTPPVNWLARHRVPRVVGAIAVYLAVFLVLAGFAYFALPRLIQELQALTETVPALGGFQFRFTLQQFGQMLQAGQQANQFGGLQTLRTLVDTVLMATDVVFTVLLILALAFLLILDGGRIVDRLVSLLPPEWRGRAEGVRDTIGHKIGGWARGVAIIALIQGTLATVGLMLLGMPFPYLLGALTGLSEFIPIIGPWLAAIPVLLVALTQSPGMLIGAAVLYLIIDLLENYVFTPWIMRHVTELPAFWVLLGVVIGGALFGVLGALLATPIALAVQVLWCNLLIPLVKRHYGEQ